MTRSDINFALKAAQRAVAEASLLVAAPNLFEYLVRKKIEDGSVPSGYVGTRRSKKQPFWNRSHQVVQYRTPLAERLIDKYRLVPLSPEDPEVLKNAYESFASDIRSEIIYNGSFDMDAQGGKFLVVEHTDDGKWEVSLRNNQGITLGRPYKVRDVREAAPEMWEYLRDQLKKEYIKRVLPVF